MGSQEEFLVTTWIQHPNSALPEWVAHHRALGATRIHLFFPERDGGIPEMIRALEASGVVTAQALIADASESAEQIRNAAIRAAELEEEGTTGFGLFLGSDEYLVLHKHENVQEMLASVRGVHAITMPLIQFAPGPERGHVPGPCLDQARERVAGTVRQVEWRSIVKQGLWGARLPSHPTGELKKPLQKVKWLNGAGKPMPKPWSRFIWQNEESAHVFDLASVAWVPAPRVETMLLRAAYAHPVKCQPMAEDLTPIVDTLKEQRIKDTSLFSNSEARAGELKALLSDKALSRAYEAQCEEENSRAIKQVNRHRLWKAILGYMDGKPIEAASVDTTLAPDAGLVPTATDAPPPVEAVPNAEKPPRMSKHQRKEVIDDTTPVKEHPGVPDAFARVATDPPPPWFAEIYPGGSSQGFFRKLEHHAIVHIERDPDTLIVSFDNISNVHDISYGREPWAYKFVQRAGCSHLAVIARRKDWYRDPQLIDEMQALAKRGLFTSYKKVVMTGTSMGGFAALTFSSLAPGCTVLAYSPQTTLDSELVPWEERFGMGRARNWSLPFSDAAFEIEDARQIFVVYDPFFEPDKKHIQRLEGDNITHLKAWFSGHFSAVFIRRANLIKPLFQQAIDGTLTKRSYYTLLRERRNLMWYRKALEERAIERGHPKLAERVGPAFRRNRRKQMQEA